MKVCIVIGSYHKKGMVRSLVDSFKKGILENRKDSEVEVIDLLDKKINFCNGCNICGKDDASKKIGMCVQKDDAHKLMQKLLECDVLVFATPIYEYSPTALMKRFLERCICMGMSTDRFPKARNKVRKDKIGVVITSTACPYPINDIILFTLYSKIVLKSICKSFGANKKYCLSAGAMEASIKARGRFVKKSYYLGAKVAKKYR
ncbi:MAG: flavodoxin family protein [Candidatus Woesearchaeota archaeon]|jgi:multimeric flavodoxin WrbA